MDDGQARRDRLVHSQYEDLPYPPRDPDDERRRLITGSPSHLAEIDHYVFGGRRDPAEPLHVLVAGGGTGDGTIMLAQQLADAAQAHGHAPGHVTYLDLSAASLEIAKARAAVRGLDNIEFLQGSLLDVAGLAPGPYDYIDCCGVLHHLEDPAAGLAALASVIKPAGGMGLMVYGTLGRTGVYPVQHALRALAPEDQPPEDRIATARKLLQALPETNWLRRNPLVADHITAGDAGLYDLLLHSRDRAYTVPEIAALTATSGLAVSGFIEPVQYDPVQYLDDPDLSAAAQALPWLERCALAENLCGTIKTHTFYAVPAARADGLPPTPTKPGTVPALRDGNYTALAKGLAGRQRLQVDLNGVKRRFELPEGAAAILAQMDGQRTLGAIQQGLGLDWIVFKQRFDRLYAVLNALNMLLIRKIG